MFTTLSNKQLLTAAIWNANWAEAEARLSAIGGNNISWPLTGGDIDMDQQYEIFGLRSLWNIINAGEYDNLEDAVADAVAAGGTSILIPPDTNVECTNATLSTSGIVIMGSGPTSVIKMLASAGPLITTGTGGLSGIGIYNLTIDMSGGNAGALGVVAQRIDRFEMGNVYFTGGKGANLKLTNGGTPGQSCTNVKLHNLHFNGGTGTSAYHIFADDLDGLLAIGLYSSGCPVTTNAALHFEQAASAKMRDLMFSTVQIDSPSGKGLSVLSNSGTASDNCSRVKVSAIHVEAPTGTGVEIGATSKIIKLVGLLGASVYGSTTIAGISVNVSHGVVTGCDAMGYAPGLDLVSSVDVFVTGNLFKDATTYGVDADGTADCTIVGNDLRDCTSAGIKKSSSTGLECVNNLGDFGKGSFGVCYPNKSLGDGTDANAWEMTLPANTLTKIGDGLIVNASALCSGTAAAATLYVRAGTTTIAKITAGYSSVTCAGVGYVRLILGPTTALNTIGWGFGSNSGTLGMAGSTDPVTIDWSVNQTLNVYIVNDAGQNATLKYVSIQVVEGTLQGAAT